MTHKLACLMVLIGVVSSCGAAGTSTPGKLAQNKYVTVLPTPYPITDKNTPTTLTKQTQVEQAPATVVQNQISNTYQQTTVNNRLLVERGNPAQRQVVAQNRVIYQSVQPGVNYRPIQLIPGTQNFPLIPGEQTIPLPEPEIIELPPLNEPIIVSTATPDKIQTPINEPPVVTPVDIDNVNVTEDDFNYALTQDVLVNLKVLNPNNNPYQGVMVYICDKECQGQQYLMRGITSDTGEFQGIIRVPSSQENLTVITSAFGVQNKAILPIQNQQINYTFQNL